MRKVIYNEKATNTACALLLAGAGIGCSQSGYNNLQEDFVSQNNQPNIIIIYADDVGYGDLGVYGSELIPTPHLDQLAEEGARFTSAYAMSSTCTPSRYSLITGKYSFRHPEANILPSDAPILIEPGEINMAQMLKSAGYRTGVIGKWHMGIGDGDIDWNTEIRPSPLDIGFDVSFVIPGTNDRVPTVWVDGHNVYNLSEDDEPLRVSFRGRVGNLPTGISHPEKLIYPTDRYHSGTIVNGISRIGWQDGGQSAWWSDQNMGMDILDRSRTFIEESTNDPFFLFMSMHQNHVPRVPHPQFEGASATGLRGDHVVELDYIVGQVVETLDNLGIREETLVIFTSDNGPVFQDSYYDGAIELAQGHLANGPFRGGKYHVYEGGTRMPTITNWPGVITPGEVSDVVMSQVDLLASLAALVGVEIPAEVELDSKEHHSAWLGREADDRDYVIQHGIGMYAIRKGDWKLILAGDTPQWVDHRHNHYQNPVSTPLPPSDKHSLFNLIDDPGESVNLVDEYPGKVEELLGFFYEIKGRD